MALECNKCCFCIDLRSECLIIGYLNLIGEFIIILMTILGLVQSSKLTAQGTQQHLEPEVLTTVAVVFAVIAVFLFYLIIYLGFTIVLLVGLHQYKRGYVKAYLIYGLIFLVLYTNVIIIIASFGGAVVPIVMQLVIILLSIYCLLMIRSYYLKMEDPTNNPATA